jgi:polyferredoxin
MALWAWADANGVSPASLRQHVPPTLQSQEPSARTLVMQYVDVGILALLLAAASYMALAKRSRKGMFVIMLIGLAYLGFYRKGCVCPIGAIQNVAQGLFDPTYATPLFVAAFLLLPLAFSLFFGRTFCGGVCPLGAVQDLMVWRPLKLPIFLEHVLGLLPLAYLAAAVLLSATGWGYVICRYDPFVAFFRMSGNAHMLMAGACVLLVGVFVARPYCRFICPLGALLRVCGHVSMKEVTIVPGGKECIKCRLCEDACPFNAIEKPSAERSPERRQYERRRLGLLIVLLPVLTGAGAALGGQLGAAHLDARLGGMLAGGFVGLAIAIRLISLSIYRRREGYTVSKARCVSCGRCYRYCPVLIQWQREQEEIARR